jgi:hypothetical protein
VNGAASVSLLFATLGLATPRSSAQSPTAPRVVIFEEDFESGTLGAFSERICPNEPVSPFPSAVGPCCTPAATFWHAESFCNACVSPPVPVSPIFGSYAAAYNRMDESPPNCTYETPGTGNAGAIETGSVFWPTWPPVPLNLAVVFDVWHAPGIGPGSGLLDRLYFESDLGVNPGPCGNDWRTLAYANVSSSCLNTPLVFTVGNHPYLDMMAGSDRPFRFRFDTIDGTDNDQQGPYVDNIRVLNSFCTACLAVEGPFTFCNPEIESTGGAPKLGNPNYALRLIGAPATASVAILMLGLSHSTWAGGSLPWVVPGTQGPLGPCFLCVSPDVLLTVPIAATTPCSGIAVQGIPIPNMPGLAGAEAFAQWAMLDPTQPAGVRLSDAAAIVVQP